MSYFCNVIDKRLDRELLTDTTNYHLLQCVHNDRLRVQADASFSETVAHTRIRLTPAGDVRLVSRALSPEPLELDLCTSCQSQTQ